MNMIHKLTRMKARIPHNKYISMDGSSCTLPPDGDAKKDLPLTEYTKWITDTKNKARFVDHHPSSWFVVFAKVVHFRHLLRPELLINCGVIKSIQKNFLH